LRRPTLQTRSVLAYCLQNSPATDYRQVDLTTRSMAAGVYNSARRRSLIWPHQLSTPHPTGFNLSPHTERRIRILRK